jgi:pimeloyl-ACP methyl ester carboxylesterase
LTRDGVRIEAERLPGTDPVGGVCVVLAHGFTGSLDRPAARRAARAFAALPGVAGVVLFSFRGHGRSGGRSTVGDREVLDLDAAVRWARRLGHRRVATVGFSMGGSVVLRHAGGGAAYAPVDAVAAVSAPARWYYRGTPAMRRLHWAVTRPAGRLVARHALRTRVHHEDWDPVPPSPVECVPAIAPVPLLVVHGDRDHYFPLDHPLSLAEAAAPGGGCELWIEPGFGHAENSASPELLDRVGRWLAAAADPTAG